MAEPPQRIRDPVIVLSRNFTYYAPEEVLCLPLRDPQAVVFGSAPQADIDLGLPVIYLQLSQNVEDRLEVDAESVIEKHVRVAPLHGSLIYRDSALGYVHLGSEPSVIAETRRDSVIIAQPQQGFELTTGRTVGLGMTTDGFGQMMWWYYFRIYSLAALKLQVRPAAPARRPFSR
jgi:hypothetical protein